MLIFQLEKFIKIFEIRVNEIFQPPSSGMELCCKICGSVIHENVFIANGRCYIIKCSSCIIY